MSEFITIQVGQCGNQIGSCLWPKILQEYEISSTNEPNSKVTKNTKEEIQRYMSSFFNFENRRSQIYDNLSDLLKDKAKARTICIDMEDAVVARFKTSKYRGLFDENCIITNYPGSGNNWAEGYYNHGPKYKDQFLDSVQYLLERCDSLHGFLLLLSTGGGTGSGLGSYLLELLSDDYPLIDRFVATVYPTGTEDVITCPYNMAFATQQFLDKASCVFPVENRALHDIMSKQTHRFHVKSQLYTSKPFEDMNSIIVDMLLHLTSGSRFSGSLNLDMNDLCTNMVPFPNLNFLSSGFSPFSGKAFPLKSTNKQQKDETFLASWNRNNQLLKLDPLDSKRVLFGATILGRGIYTISDMRSYVDKLKKKCNFATWSKKSLKIALCNIAPYNMNVSMLSVTNSSSMLNLFETILNQFMKLYKRKAHVHHYMNVQNFETEQFENCQDDLRNILDMYNKLETMIPVKIPRLSLP